MKCLNMKTKTTIETNKYTHTEPKNATLEDGPNNIPLNS